MLKKLGRHLSQQYIGCVALLLALSGTAYAAATIGSRQVTNNSLQSVDLKDNAAVKSADVRDADLAGGGLGNEDLASGSVDGSKVTDDALTGQDVNERTLRDNRVQRGELDLNEILSLEIPEVKTMVFVSCRADELDIGVYNNSIDSPLDVYTDRHDGSAPTFDRIAPPEPTYAFNNINYITARNPVHVTFQVGRNWAAGNSSDGEQIATIELNARRLGSSCEAQVQVVQQEG